MKNILILTCISFLFLKCNEQKVLKKPNILFILSEDNGRDLGCYGNTYVHTPNLDKLAAEGIKFENAYVTYSVCSPSRGTIFTGLYPHQNGQIGLATHKYRMYEEIKTLPKYMKELGYRTGCIGKVHVNPISEIPWDFRPKGLLSGANFGKKSMEEYAIQASKFIRANDAPFYLQINFPDAHFPVQRQVEGLPSKVIEKEYIKATLPFVGVNSKYLQEYTANYYNSMNRLDESIGILLDSLELIGQMENTIIIYMSDHGAQFSRGKCSNYEAGIKVPLIVKWGKKIKHGEIREELVSSLDLLPTFIDIAGGTSPNILEGKSIIPLLKSPQKMWRDHLFVGGAGATPGMHFPRRSVRGEQFKLILNINSPNQNPHYDYYTKRKGHFIAGTIPQEIENSSDKIKRAYEVWKNPPKYELYDLDNDPNEFENLSNNPKYKKELHNLISVMKKWQNTTNDPFGVPDKLKKINEEMKEVKKNYPNKTYTKDKNFKWKYVDYFVQ